MVSGTVLGSVVGHWAPLEQMGGSVRPPNWDQWPLCNRPPRTLRLQPAGGGGGSVEKSKLLCFCQCMNTYLCNKLVLLTVNCSSICLFCPLQNIYIFPSLHKMKFLRLALACLQRCLFVFSLLIIDLV
ncbi:hypothetical protein AAFF_G00212510 [Aldrovandia affinis]|uniref:Uncharacterized protein n=1 Tax=Aldrovandia affinis TaxID=143900 RepID=A0AAD7RHH0_9TELE|nr:hypothetical protein AAFF_G00212510 [Aldrovandia affinis]